MINIQTKTFSNEEINKALDVIAKMGISREQAKIDTKPLIEAMSTMTVNERLIASVLVQLINQLNR